MRRIIWAVAAMAVCAAMQLVAAQTLSHSPAAGAARPAKTPEAVFDATRLGSPLQLNQDWRVGVTSDPAAAAPGFDDSGWAIRSAQATFAGIPGAGDSAAEDRPLFAWYRLHLRLAPGHAPVALLIDLPVYQNTTITFGSQALGVDVFANGRLIVPEGPHAASADNYQQISRIYDLDVAPGETSLVLAVRSVYVPLGLGAYTSFFAGHTLWLGGHEDLDHLLELWSNQNLFERLPHLVCSLLLLSLAVFLLALFFTQKGHSEYLWLALHELFQAPVGFVELAGRSARLDQFWFAALSLQLLLLSAYLYFEFLIAFLSLRRRWTILALRFTSPVMAVAGPALLLAGHGAAMDVVLAVSLLGSLCWILGWLVFVLVTLIQATLRRNYEAGLLLIPLLLTLVGWSEPILTGALSNWGSGAAVTSPLTIEAGPIPIDFASIADLAGMVAIVLIIFGRFLRVQREQERASSELAAARSVQEMMIPQEKLETPGFEVESIYNPANEVGGDFYSVQATPEGGLMVVLGDVAGKGLQAAMNVSMLMGVLRQSQENNPAAILESLNRVLVGSDSFTTCQAAWFGPDGELVLANAGHLPPYLTSQEVPLAGSLPLGVLPEAHYELVRLYLHPGDRLLLFSDGVVEARQPSGELFGFDRVHNLSNQSAFYLAEAARSFGQEDDITVVTVRRLATETAA
ncbi:MAG: PP2C family protein-serine/threonine phosphatase [Terracidiphilus sp.]